MDGALRAKVLSGIADFLHVDARTVGSLRSRKLHDSDRRIYELTVGAFPERFVLKQRGSGARKPEDLEGGTTRREFDRLRLAWAAAQGSDGRPLAMPVPVAAFDAEQALLTTRCEGRELRKYFRRTVWLWPLNSGSLEAAFAGCGRWLAHFHTATIETRPASGLAGNRMAHLRRMTAQIAASPNNGMSGGELDELCGDIGAALTARAGTETALLHGNFTLRNLLIEGSEAAPVDFEDSREDCIYLDVAQLVADLLASRYLPHISQAAVNACIEAFLNTYAGMVSIDRRELNAYVAYHLVALHYELATRAGLTGLRRMIALRRIRNLERQLRRVSLHQ